MLLRFFTKACALCGLLLTTAHAASNDSNEWPSYSGNLASDRFSTLTHITARNAASLQERCEVDLGDPGALQAGPVMVGGILYVTTTHTVVAVDAADCSLRWRSVYETHEDELWPVNRGVVYMDGHVFRGTGDDRLLSLDVITGKQDWEVQVVNPQGRRVHERRASGLERARLYRACGR